MFTSATVADGTKMQIQQEKNDLQKAFTLKHLKAQRKVLAKIEKLIGINKLSSNP